MKRSLLCLALAASTLAGCAGSDPRPNPEPSSFVDQFSLSAAAGQLAGTELVPPVTGIAGGPATGREISRFRKDSQVTFKIRDGAAFDEQDFLRRVLAAARKEAAAEGFRVSGSQVVGNAMHFEYSGRDRVGSVEVFGARTEGGTFTMFGVIHEDLRERRRS